MVRYPAGDSTHPSASPTKSWRHQTSGNTRASRRREELGLPCISDREAERRLRDKRSCTARRQRAAARARGVATAALGTPDVPTAIEGVAPIEPAERLAARLGSFQARPQGEPVLTMRLGGTRRPISPCQRCRTCECQTNRDYSAAQDLRSPTSRRPSHTRRQSTSSRRRSTSRRRQTRSPKRDTLPGPPQLRREEEQKEETSAKDEETLSWDEAQTQFGLRAGPMRQLSGSLVTFFDAETCDLLIQDLQGVDGTIPDFASVGSDPGSPPPALEAGPRRTGHPNVFRAHTRPGDRPTGGHRVQVGSGNPADLTRPPPRLRPPVPPLRPTRAPRSCYGPLDRWHTPRPRRRPGVPLGPGPRHTAQHRRLRAPTCQS